MPQKCYFFCSNESVKLLENTLQEKRKANQILLEDFGFLSIALAKRQLAFDWAVANAQKAKDQEQASIFLRTAILFEKTAKRCLVDPQNMAGYIDAYYRSSDYVHVCNFALDSYTKADSYAIRVGYLSLLICFGSLIALSIGLTPMAPVILAGIALTLLVPTAYYHFVITRPHQESVKTQETAIFKAFEERIEDQYLQVKGV